MREVRFPENPLSFCPFSHQPGACYFLPDSIYAWVIYPTRLEMWNYLHNPKCNQIFFFSDWGVASLFGHCQDLRRRELRVWGKSERGFFLYVLSAIRKDSIGFFLKRMTFPSWELSSFEGEQAILLHKGATFTFDEKGIDSFSFSRSTFSQKGEELFLGIHKKPQWEKIWERFSLEELFPLLFSLGSAIPSHFAREGEEEPILQSLHSLAREFSTLDKNRFRQVWIQILRSHFSPTLIPQWEDRSFWQRGKLSLEERQNSPFLLLIRIREILRILFLQEEGEDLYVLCTATRFFSHGRCSHFKYRTGSLSFDWRSKKIRRVLLFSEEATSLRLFFPPSHRSFRLRRVKEKTRGERYFCEGKLSLQAGVTYLLDQFHN